MLKKNILYGPLKRVAAIHDISGFGKCSLTVAIPILSAAGVEVCPVPTAVLSTHTGGFEGFTFRDLTDDLEAFTNHWKSLSLKFSAIYTGFLGSATQVQLVSDFLDIFKREDNIVLIDPAMADNGVLYSIFDESMIVNMRGLAQKADVLVPNMTEAAFMLNREYNPGPYTEEYVSDIVEALGKLGPKEVVLTGIYFHKDHLGAASYNKKTNSMKVAFNNRIPGLYHGTGDVFASFLLAGLLNQKNLDEATAFAVDLTQASIARTHQRKTALREGVDFEGVLPEMMIRLNFV